MQREAIDRRTTALRGCAVDDCELPLARPRPPRASIKAARHAALALSLAALSVHAQQPAAFANGDPQQGHPLVDKNCNECHARLFGDPERIYARPDHRVKTPEQLRAQVAFCNTQLGAGLFPEEEEHIAAWLNQRYYHFKP